MVTIYYNEKDLLKLRKNQRLMCGNCNHPIWLFGLHYGDRQTNECGYYSEESGACGCCDVDCFYIETIKKKKEKKNE